MGFEVKLCVYLRLFFGRSPLQGVVYDRGHMT